MVAIGIRQCHTGPDLLRRKSNRYLNEGCTRSSGLNNNRATLSARSENTAKLKACSCSIQVTPSGVGVPSAEIQDKFRAITAARSSWEESPNANRVRDAAAGPAIPAQFHDGPMY